jgi:two-component system, sensor histidine kinase and response regulator
MSDNQQEAAAPECLLIVEGDASNRAILQRVLEQDYSLLFAQNDGEVLAALRTHPVDLVLLDSTSPEIPVLDLLASVRSEWNKDTLPVILLTSLDNSDAAVRGLQLGGNDYITKPLDAGVVRARVETQISLRKAVKDETEILTQLKFTQEMQENFSRIVSHNLKGPLTNIRMAQFMLRDILRENGDANDILDHMDATLLDMIEMVRMFLDAMDSQQLAPQIEPVNSHELFVEIVDQYQLAAERKGIQLIISEEPQQLLGDKRLLRQVISNLVSNAVKFSQPGTQTCIEAQRNNGNVRISVTDHGPGIPSDERDKLFTMFTKLSTRPTGGETSTGLGLWIVKELTELQKGTVGFDQPAEGGSRFWVELPAADKGA